MPECARPRAQQLASFQPKNISQLPAYSALLRPGRPHSANAETNFEVRVESINANSAGQNAFLVKIGRADK